MKTCPQCYASVFDDMDVCYECLYRFGDPLPGSVPAPEQVVAPELQMEPPTLINRGLQEETPLSIPPDLQEEASVVTRAAKDASLYASVGQPEEVPLSIPPELQEDAPIFMGSQEIPTPIRPQEMPLASHSAQESAPQKEIPPLCAEEELAHDGIAPGATTSLQAAVPASLVLEPESVASGWRLSITFDDSVQKARWTFICEPLQRPANKRTSYREVSSV